MTLNRLCELAYMCEYVELEELGAIKGFTETWSNLLDVQLENLRLSRLDLDGMEQDFISIGGYKL